MLPDTSHMATIVVVEDDPTVAELVRAVLNDVPGWGAVVAYDARSALTLLEHVRPDVMVVDVNLPGMSGIEMLAQLRQTPGWHEPPVVVMSANVPQERVEQALGKSGKSGAGGRLGHVGHAGSGSYVQFLPKPFDIDELIDSVALAIECRRQEVRRPAPRETQSQAATPAEERRSRSQAQGQDRARRSLAAGA
jgi:CheY-like chemotaxis protein